MATRTALILAGVGHPNDDGLLGPTIETFWLSENSRASWTLWLPGRTRPKHLWVCYQPDTILEDGLALVIHVLLGKPDEAIDSPGSNPEPHPATRRDLSKLTPIQHRFLIDEARRNSARLAAKLIITSFHGSSILGQFGSLQGFALDVEVLEPSATRLWSRWLRRHRYTGFLSEERR